MGFPGGTSGKEPACQCRRHKRRGFEPWVGKKPWRRAQQPTPVFLPRESHGQRSLVGCCPQGHEESDMTEATECAWHIHYINDHDWVALGLMQTWPCHSTSEWYPTHPSFCIRDSQRVAPRASKSLVNEHHAWPRDGINQCGLGKFRTLCAVLQTAAELWTLTKGQTVRTQVLPTWPFLIYFPPNHGLSTHSQREYRLQWKPTDTMLRGHEVSGVLMTYTQVGRAGASGYSPFRKVPLLLLWCQQSYLSPCTLREPLPKCHHLQTGPREAKGLHTHTQPAKHCTEASSGATVTSVFLTTPAGQASVPTKWRRRGTVFLDTTGVSPKTTLSH